MSLKRLESTKMVKKTVAELNKDVEILSEKFEMLRSNHEERINIMKSDHEERIKTLEAKLIILEKCNAPLTSEAAIEATIKCKECGVLLKKSSELNLLKQSKGAKNRTHNPLKLTLCSEDVSR